MRIKQIDTVCFVGAGSMGCYNSLLAGMAGYDAVVYDISEEQRRDFAARQQALGGRLARLGVFDRARSEEGRKRVRLEPDIEAAVRDADLLSESVPERLDVKRQVHRQLDALCPAKTIQTTNTSSLLVSELEDAVARGDRFAAMHFHMASVLVDIVGGPRTAPETIDVLTRFVKSLDCVPFTKAKENRGYVYNSMVPGTLMPSIALVAAYNESIEDVDRAWMACHDGELGPFARMDGVGLKLQYDIFVNGMKRWGENRQTRLEADMLKPYVERGEYGFRTGKGFYSYPNPAYAAPGFLTDVEPRRDIDTVLVNGIILRALKLVIDGVTDFHVVDWVWMICRGARSGPFGWLDSKGIDIFLAELEAEQRDLLYVQYEPDSVKRLLEPFVEKGQTGERAGKGFYTYPNPAYKDPAFLTESFAA